MLLLLVLLLLLLELIADVSLGAFRDRGYLNATRLVDAVALGCYLDNDYAAADYATLLSWQLSYWLPESNFTTT